MPTRRAINAPIPRKSTVVNAPKASGGLTLGDIFSFVANIKAAQLLYILLLVAVFSIGYLLARVQLLEEGGIAKGLGGTAQTGQAPSQETVPDAAAPEPKEVVEKLAAIETNPEEVNDKFKGNKDAKVTIVEYSDFECPFCARFYSDTLPQLTEEYIDTGKVAFYYRHYPLSFHPNAVPAALATECANDQGKFWEMHDKIFEENNAGKIGSATSETFKQYALDLGLDSSQFDPCLDDKTHQAKVDEEFAEGNNVSVSGTPTFYINGRQLVGAQPFAAFKAIIDEELKK